ncbi:MAG TPA: hypothetical protein VLE70_13930 [Anaerolineae bacterium]|nr:hypothetical protein [Anaerolineae bacterium]
MWRMTRRALPGLLTALSLLLIIAFAVGCKDSSSLPDEKPAQVQSAPAAEPTLDPLAQAAAEATAIVQRAEATAMVLQAEAVAADMVQNAAGTAETVGNDGVSDGQLAAPAGPTATPAPAVQPSASETFTPKGTDIEIVSVSFAGEGGFIFVQYYAPPAVASRWNQGLVSVTDEETGHEYLEIPMMPKVGALIGKPIRLGQPGYVMFVNGPVPLQPGAMVTVKLGNYIEEGITVQG